MTNDARTPANARTDALAAIVAARAAKTVSRILVVGCGDGAEARALARIIHLGVSSIAYPSVYVVGRKAGQA